MTLFDDFLVRATLAGLGVALAAGPLGCFVLWRRMAYFSDATAHGGLLGVAMALLFEVPIMFAVVCVALLMALLLTRMSGRLSTDGLLGVFSHGALALGLLSVALVPAARVDLAGYLLGDILAVGKDDLAVIWAGVVLVLAGLVWRWQALLTATLDPDLATASGIRPEREQLLLTLALAIVVAVALQVVGALLIGALLVLPAAAMRPLAATPERLALMAAVAGGGAALGGMALSVQVDTPTGPTIVALAFTVFVLVHSGSAVIRRLAG